MYKIHVNDIACSQENVSVWYSECSGYYALHNIIHNILYRGRRVHKEPWFIYRALSYIIIHRAHTQCIQAHYMFHIPSKHTHKKEEIPKNEQKASKTAATTVAGNDSERRGGGGGGNSSQYSKQSTHSRPYNIQLSFGYRFLARAHPKFRRIFHSFVRFLDLKILVLRAHMGGLCVWKRMIVCWKWACCVSQMFHFEGNGTNSLIVSPYACTHHTEAIPKSISTGWHINGVCVRSRT